MTLYSVPPERTLSALNVGAEPRACALTLRSIVKLNTSRPSGECPLLAAIL